MKLIIGLGNPGREYNHTRHNMGFDVVDLLSDSLGIDITNKDFHGLYGYKRNIPNKDDVVMLFKPTTFMNLSGKAVNAIVDYFKIDLDDILVVYDDLDTPPGEIRVKLSGSSGGHHGIEDIIRVFGTEDIRRVRVGIGRPIYDTVSYVLSKPKDKEEKKMLEEGKAQAAAAALTFIRDGVPKRQIK